jgi:hypothetical protein
MASAAIGARTGGFFAAARPGEWLRALVEDALLAGATLAAFRLLQSGAAAVPVAAVAYALLAKGSIPLVGAVAGSDLGDPPGVLPVAVTALWAACFLGGLEVAVGWVRPVPLALWLGSTVGVIASRVVQTILFVWFDVAPFRLASSTVFLALALVASAVFAVAFWAGLRLASAGAPLARSRSAPFWPT